MILYQNPLSFLHKKRTSLLLFSLSLVCFLLVIPILLLNSYLNDLIPETIGFNLFNYILLFIILLGELFLLICFFLTKHKTIKIVSSVLFTFVIIPILLFTFMVRPNRIVGESMLPALEHGEYVLGSLITYRFTTPKRGDIVVFGSPSTPNEVKYVARVIGLPNERIKVLDCKVYIDDNLFSEPYLIGNTCTGSASFLMEGYERIIPSDSYFMMADNRPNSFDSRHYGFIKSNLIEHKLVFVFLPFNHLRVLRGGY